MGSVVTVFAELITPIQHVVVRQIDLWPLSVIIVCRNDLVACGHLAAMEPPIGIQERPLPQPRRARGRLGLFKARGGAGAKPEGDNAGQNRAKAPPDNDIFLTHIQLVPGIARKFKHGDCSKEKR